MGTFRVELREAKPTNGHTGEDPITCVDMIEANDWTEARTMAARRHGIEVWDPAMIATEAEPADFRVERPLKVRPKSKAK